MAFRLVAESSNAVQLPFAVSRDCELSMDFQFLSQVNMVLKRRLVLPETLHPCFRSVWVERGVGYGFGSD